MTSTKAETEAIGRLAFTLRPQNTCGNQEARNKMYLELLWMMLELTGRSKLTHISSSFKYAECKVKLRLDTKTGSTGCSYF